jgi:prenyltransferase beta subunit
MTILNGTSCIRLLTSPDGYPTTPQPRSARQHYVCLTLNTILNALISEAAEIRVQIICNDLFWGGGEGELLTARHHVDVTYSALRSPFLSISSPKSCISLK